GLWHLANQKDDWRAAARFGLVLAVSTFITYNLLVLGAMLAAMPLMLTRAPFVERARRAAKLSLVAGFVVVLFYAALLLGTYFDPIATFRSAWKNQQGLLAAHRADRPYPWTILFDLLDFLLGAGWVVVLPVLYQLRARSPLILLFLAQPVLV